jgi:hypothetical protein
MNHDQINEFNLIDQYVLGKLSADEAEAFENHFIDCPECVDQLNVTRSLVQDLKGLAVQETLVSENRRAPMARWWHLERLVPIRYWPVIACFCIVVAGLFAFFAVRRMTRLEDELSQTKQDSSAIRQQYQRELEIAAVSEKQHQEARQQLTQRLDELEQQIRNEETVNHSSPSRGSATPEVNFPIFALVSVERGQTPAPVEIALPASSPSFALSIQLEDSRKFDDYRVTILDQREVAVWKQSGFRPDAYHSLSLSLNSSFLKSGTYDLRVEGLTRPNKWELVGSYRFRFTRRR